ncbi:hypothetical protein [Olivibacter domesticus]|uniref:Uncharacterized protein n=1 Tax=Olivibacter domesticus TaxID=407022 RepID=A0A1H7IDL9_OLID1|nr:hypothetical protein [Olivibacter domesticus]SEK60559.1 hypothetical protein SAMN05661044_00666 [Olivibacter domesticus]
MKIEVKNILFPAPKKGGSSLSFRAKLYINDVHVAACINYGRGEPTILLKKGTPCLPLILQAQLHCAHIQPSRTNQNMAYTGELPHLRAFIDERVHNFYQHLQKFQQAVTALQKESIVIGIPGKNLTTVLFPSPIQRMCNNFLEWQQLTVLLLTQVLPKMKEGELILNTNIPKVVLVQAGLKPYRTVVPLTERNSSGRKERRARRGL